MEVAVLSLYSVWYKKIHISDDAKSMLGFESALTDIFAVIIAFVLFEAALSGEFSLDLLGITIGKAVLVGLVLGFGVWHSLDVLLYQS